MRTPNAKVAGLKRLVTERQAKVAELQAIMASFVKDRHTLSALVAEEEKHTKCDDPTNIRYSLYAKAITLRVVKCDETIATLKVLLQEAQEALASAQSDLDLVLRVQSRPPVQEASRRPKKLEIPPLLLVE